MVNNTRSIFFIALIVGAGACILGQAAYAAPIAERLAGRIVLQVEQKGKAWYIEPASQARAYLGRPSDAFRVMRELGVGVTNADLERITKTDEDVVRDVSFAKRLAGKILLQVEAHGEAWYVHPVNFKRYFLGRPADAFRVMRELGLGISNSDLEGIPGNESFADQEQPFASIKKSNKEAQSTEHAYSNPEKGVAVSYPEPWEAVSLEDINKESADRAAQLQHASGKYIAVLTVYRTEDDAPQKTVSTLTNDSIIESKKQKNFIKSTSLTINKQKVTGFSVYESREAGGKEKVFRVLIPGDTVYYETVYSIDSQGTASITSKAAYQFFDKMLAPATAIMQSLRFSKPVLGPTVEYRNNDYGFALLYPKERWEQDMSSAITKDSSGATIIATFNPPTGSLIIRKPKNTRGSLENYYENVLANYESAAGFTIVNTGPISHKAGKAYQTELIIDTDGTAVHFFDTYISKDDIVYELSYSAVSAGYFRYLNQAKRTVQSFRFIEPRYTLNAIYTDKKSGVRFSYPSEWSPMAFGDIYGGILIQSAGSPVGVSYVKWHETLPPSTTLEEYVANSLQLFTLAGFTIRQQPTVVAGIPATRVSAILTNSRRSELVFLFKDGKGMSVAMNGLDDTVVFDRFLPVFESIVSSFHFTQ